MLESNIFTYNLSDMAARCDETAVLFLGEYCKPSEEDKRIIDAADILAGQDGERQQRQFSIQCQRQRGVVEVHRRHSISSRSRC